MRIKEIVYRAWAWLMLRPMSPPAKIKPWLSLPQLTEWVCAASADASLLRKRLAVWLMALRASRRGGRRRGHFERRPQEASALANDHIARRPGSKPCASCAQRKSLRLQPDDVL